MKVGTVDVDEDEDEVNSIEVDGGCRGGSSRRDVALVTCGANRGEGALAVDDVRREA